MCIHIKKCCIFAASFQTECLFGVWRSWLAHLHGVQGVESSSLFTPTNEKKRCLKASLFLFYFCHIHPTDAKGETSDRNLSKSRLLEHRHKLRRLGELHDRGWQIVIGILVALKPTTHLGQQSHSIEFIAPQQKWIIWIR